MLWREGAWCMVRDDDCRPRMGLGQPAFKPPGVSATQGGRVIGREQSWHGLIHVNFAEITHETLRFLHRQRTLLAVSPKHEIGLGYGSWFGRPSLDGRPDQVKPFQMTANPYAMSVWRLFCQCHKFKLTPLFSFTDLQVG